MHGRLHNILLILITLSVAFAPLRGAWALPDMGTSDPGAHCAGMQQMDDNAQPDGDTSAKPHKCKSGCKGSCCQLGCTVCLNTATPAIPSGINVLQCTTTHTAAISASDSYPERPSTPPLRPPHTLHC